MGDPDHHLRDPGSPSSKKYTEVVAEAPDLENLPVLKNEEKDEKDGHPMGSNEVHDQSSGCYTYEQPPLFGKERNSLWMEAFFFQIHLAYGNEVGGN